MFINFKKLNENAILPEYAKHGDAGLDLIATTNALFYENGEYYYFEYGTGLSVEIPIGYVGLLFPRSSISTTILSQANAVGIIDSGYRGEIKVRYKVDLAYKTRYEPKIYFKGDKIAQLIILPYPRITPQFVSELSETDRGNKGFGSTGK